MPFRPIKISQKSLTAYPQRILSPAKALARIKSSSIPENGWSDQSFRTGNGRQLIVDLIAAERVSMATGIRKLTPRLTRWFNQVLEQVIDVFTEKFNRMYGERSVDKWDVKRLQTIVIDAGMHESMWGSAIDEVMRERGLDFVSINTNAIQSTVDSAHAATVNLIGGVTDRGVRARLNTRVRDLASQVAGINDTTRERMNAIVNRSIADGHTVAETAKRLREQFTDFSRARISTIARTEMGQAADEGRKQALKDAGNVTHVSVIGCEAREPGSPQYNGESTCNAQDVPIKDMDKLVFHPNHTGTIVPSRFVDEETRTTPAVREDPIANPDAPPTPAEIAPPTPSNVNVDPTAGHGTIVPPRIGEAVSKLNLDPVHERMRNAWEAGKGVYAAEAQALRITPTELLSRMDSKLQDILSPAKTAMAVRVDPVTFGQVLDDGRFKSQFETGTSGGSLDNAFRKQTETELFGASSRLPKDKRPIYGYVAQRSDPTRSLGASGEHTNLEHYGTATVVLKDSVRERATWTGTDSLSQRGLLAPSPVNAPSGLSMSGVSSYSGFDANSIRKASILNVNNLAEVDRGWHTYFEAQYWDGLSLTDIKEVIFAIRPPKAIIDKLAKAGISWRV